MKIEMEPDDWQFHVIKINDGYVIECSVVCEEARESFVALVHEMIEVDYDFENASDRTMPIDAEARALIRLLKSVAWWAEGDDNLLDNADYELVIEWRKKDGVRRDDGENAIRVAEEDCKDSIRTTSSINRR